ncbi:hypothetical protein ACWIG4_30210 [Streptomyces sp. NPDC002248]
MPNQRKETQLHLLVGRAIEGRLAPGEEGLLWKEVGIADGQRHELSALKKRNTQLLQANTKFQQIINDLRAYALNIGAMPGGIPYVRLGGFLLRMIKGEE